MAYLLFAIQLNLLFAVIAGLAKAMRLPALVIAGAVGVGLLHLTRMQGYVPWLVFVAGSAIAARVGGARQGVPSPTLSAMHLAATGLPPLAFAWASTLFPDPSWRVAIAAGFAAAFGDVAARELGMRLNPRPLKLPLLNRVDAGTRGAASPEGCIYGLAAACVAGLAASLAGGPPFADVWIVVAAAAAANVLDTLLGAAASGRSPWAAGAIDAISTSFACSLAFTIARVAQ